MKRIHALVIAAVLAVAGVAGTFAALKTTALGVEAATVSDADLAKRTQKLNRAAKQLRNAAKRRPPALPAVPARVSSGGGSSGAVLASAPAPVVVSNSGPGSLSSGSGGHGGGHHEFEDEGGHHHHGRGRGRGRGGDHHDDVHEDRRDDDRRDDDRGEDDRDDD